MIMKRFALLLVLPSVSALRLSATKCRGDINYPAIYNFNNEDIKKNGIAAGEEVGRSVDKKINELCDLDPKTNVGETFGKKIGARMAEYLQGGKKTFGCEVNNDETKRAKIRELMRDFIRDVTDLCSTRSDIFKDIHEAIKHFD